MMLTNRQIRVRFFESLKNSFFKKSGGISVAVLFILLITALSL
ncbi:cell division protein FtsL, partial [Francisella tularensis subsp. holarctica]|nr:cell division protein FtsL [Francisella tularensis subsp. holarctica]